MTDQTHDATPLNDSKATPEDDWASATTIPTPTTQADGLQPAQEVTDDWASALAEQTATSAPATTVSETDISLAAASHVFPQLNSAETQGSSDIDMIMDIPVQLSVELGRTRLTIKNILQLGQGSVVELDGFAGEPMDIYVNGYLIAQGEVVVVDEKYGIRVTDIITPSDRISRQNSKR